MLVMRWEWPSSTVNVYQGVGLCLEPHTDKDLDASLTCWEFTKDDEDNKW